MPALARRTAAALRQTAPLDHRIMFKTDGNKKAS